MAVDLSAFRQTVGQFVTGVTVIAADIGGTIRAMTANSFTSLSLDPPLVLFCVGKHTKMGELIQDAAGFCVNILQQDQQHLSTYFAGGWKDEAPPAFTFEAWDGGPLLAGSAAAAAFSRIALAQTSSSTPIVETAFGRIRGRLTGRVNTYKGVPYGASTAGPARFLPPSKPQPWTGVRDAFELGLRCPQQQAQ